MDTINAVNIESPWIEGSIVVDKSKKALISIVTYQHHLGMPARFYAGLIPAITLSKQLQAIDVRTVIRLIDPTTIANHCNGWETNNLEFKKIISEFLSNYDVEFFFDESECVSGHMIEALGSLGRALDASTDEIVADMVQRISESGRKHGGEIGAANALMYMAAHPFSWLDMYHPLIWKTTYSPKDYDCINLMSKAEARFALIRQSLQQLRPDLATALNPKDYYMTICNTPCYIPLEREPRIEDLSNHGYDWCYNQYHELRKMSSNHGRALKDFAAVMSFMTLRRT